MLPSGYRVSSFSWIQFNLVVEKTQDPDGAPSDIALPGKNTYNRIEVLGTVVNQRVEPYPRTWAEINLVALGENIAQVKKCISGAPVALALVAKADAYGHGLVPVSRFAVNNGAEWIAVATVQEGIALRDAGLVCPIMAMSPMLPIEADQAVFYDLDVFFENLELANALNAAAISQHKQARLHLKIDTGLHRFGCLPVDAPEIAQQAGRLSGLKLVGLAQHFANSSSDPEYTNFQLREYQSVLIECAKRGVRFEINQLANSAGALKFPNSRGNLVRIGILAYGIDPYQLLSAAAHPVMTWNARITSMREVPAGSKLGYSGTYVTPSKAKIATVGVGYGDGYPRNLSNCGFVGVSGRLAKVVGLVCMDQLLIDVTHLEGVEVGAVVELVGPHIRAEKLAELSHTNSHEIVTRVMSRVPRRYIYSR